MNIIGLQPSQTSALRHAPRLEGFVRAISNDATRASYMARQLSQNMDMLTSRPRWELAVQQDMRDAEEQLTKALSDLRDASAKMRLLPVGASYVEAAE